MEPVLVAFNAYTDDRGPVEFAHLACHIAGAPLVVLWVYRGGEAVGKADTRTLGLLREDLARRGCAADVRAVPGWSVGVEITDAAARLRAQMIVLGTTRRGAAQAALLGTTAERVIQSAACPVAVVPRDYVPPAGGIHDVGVAYAPTPEGEFALGWAAAFARAGRARLRALHVAEAGRPGAEAALSRALGAAAAGVDAHAEVLHDDDPAGALVTAGRGLELLVMGSRGGGSSRAMMLGSVSRKVAERAACPVLILPRAAQAAAVGLLRSLARHGAAPVIADSTA